jgi:transcriptional regulator with XRE-family HTH domain
MASHDAAPKGSPRQVFGSILRFYRDRAGLTREELAARAHVSTSTIRAYEEGRRVPTRASVVDIEAVQELGTSGALLELWEQFEVGMSYAVFPAWVQDWAEDVEPRANRLRWFEPNVVPGLLQTTDYAQAIFKTRFGITDEETSERVEARIRRQKILSREQPPALRVILDEWVLRRPIGGAAVMEGQVIHLIEAARQPLIVIRVLPASVGAHEGLYGGGFVVADFDDEDEPTVGFQEGAVEGGHQIRDRKGVATLETTWDTLRDEALPRGASLDLLEKTAKSWTSPE